MQVSKETEVTLAGRQEPVLDASQLKVGVIFTSLAGNFIWQVMEGDWKTITIAKLPTLEAGKHIGDHTWATSGKGVACPCGSRRESVKEFLPLMEGRARFHIIEPTGALMTPQPYTIYAYITPKGTKSGGIKFVKLTNTEHGSAPTWSDALPLFPELHKVWEVPEGLREYVKPEADKSLEE